MVSRIALLTLTVLIATGCLQKTKSTTSGGAVTAPPAPPAGKIDYQFPTSTTNFLGKIRLVATISEVEAPDGTWKASVDGGTICSGSLSATDSLGKINVDCRAAASAGSHQVALTLYGEDGNASVTATRTIRNATDSCAGSLPNAMDLNPPATLSATCLYDNIGLRRVSESMRPYTPQFQLWTDNAQKARWIYLPPLTQINTADQENWVFPAGTRIFKEFRQDGKRVETRMLVKTAAAAGPASWVSATYAWRADQADADLTVAGAANTLGTVHDIPAAAACTTCHQGAADFVLGFDAIQLSKASPFEETNFASLRADALITNIPASDYVIPGTTAQQGAIGYLHANCASCHNPIGSAAGQLLNFKHNLAAANHVSENAYVTGLAQAKFVAGDAANSRIVIRMSTRTGGMPPVGTELSDPSGLAVVREWILGL